MNLQENISRENLIVLMQTFYTRALQDRLLAPYFIDELGHDLQEDEWVEHIELLADFWLAKILKHDTYSGNFVGTHGRIPYIKREAFDRWLELFNRCVDEQYEPAIALRFKKKAKALTVEFLNNALAL